VSDLTLTSFVASLRAVEVTGVRRYYAGPPASVTTSDLPALWLNGARIAERPLARGGVDWATATAEFFLVVGPVSQSRPEDSFASSVTYADALRSALAAAALGMGPTTVEVRTAILTINEKSYWGAVGTVEAQG